MQRLFGTFKLRRYRKIGLRSSCRRSRAWPVWCSTRCRRIRSPSLNRIADFVFVNDALFSARDQEWLGKIGVHFPQRSADDNERLRLIAIDEALARRSQDGGIGQWPWPRAIHGALLKRLAKAGAKVVAFDVDVRRQRGRARQRRRVRRRDRKKCRPRCRTRWASPRAASWRRNRSRPTLLPYAATSGFTTVDNPGGWLVGQHLTINTFDDKGKPLDTYTSIAGATVSYFAKDKIVNVDPWEAKVGDTVVPLDGEG